MCVFFEKAAPDGMITIWGLPWGYLTFPHWEICLQFPYGKVNAAIDIEISLYSTPHSVETPSRLYIEQKFGNKK